MQLYHSLTSPFARKVRAVLLEKRLAFDGIDVAGSGRSPAERNPLAKVPTLVLDDGEVLYDSAVIVEALDALHPSPRLIPTAPRERARVRRWEALADGLCDVLIPVVYATRRPAETQDQAYLEKLEGKVRAVLDYVDSQVPGREYLEGSSFSLADIAWVSAVGYVELRRPSLLEGHEASVEFCERMLARPSLRNTVPPRLPIPS